MQKERRETLTMRCLSYVPPILALIFGAGCMHFRNTDSSVPMPRLRVELRLCESAPSADHREMSLYGTNVKVYVESTVRYSNSDISHATFVLESIGPYKQPKIILHLTERARSSFVTFTSNNHYKSLAIIVGDSVLSHPIISEPITGGRIAFVGKFTKEEAESFVREINRH